MTTPARKKILITGGSGFIGSFICRKLLELGHQPIVYDAFIQYISPFESRYQQFLSLRFRGIKEQVIFHRGDTRDRMDVRHVLQKHKPEIIIHLAALPIADMSFQHPGEAIGSILTGTVNFLDEIGEMGSVERFVYTSSSMVYGDFIQVPAPEDHPKSPKDIYGGTKLAGEIMTQTYGRRHGIKYTIVRPSAVYGPTDINRRVSQIFLENAIDGKPLILHGGEDNTLDFTYVEDIAQGIVLAATSPGGGKRDLQHHPWRRAHPARICGDPAQAVSQHPGEDSPPGLLPPQARRPCHHQGQRVDRLYPPLLPGRRAGKLYQVHAGCDGVLLMEKIPLCRAWIGEEEKASVLNVLESGWLTHGPKTTEFETRFAEYHGVRHAIAMNSCTSALFLAIAANGITGEVLLPSFTFVASANAILTAGATPVFVEVDPRDRNLDPDRLAHHLTPATQAIMVVHYGGQCADMARISAFARQHGLLLIEDSAETIGGTFDGQLSGSWGIGCYSFFPTKNITTGEGGMFTTNDDAMADKVRALIGHGIVKTTYERSQQGHNVWERAATHAGYNFRLSNLLSAIGVEQLKRLDTMNDLRRERSFQLMEALKEVEEVGLPHELPLRRHVFQMFTITVQRGDRNLLVNTLRERGIEASVHFDPPVHRHPAYAGCPHGDLSMTEWLSGHIVTLPMFPQMTRNEVNRVADAIKEFFVHG